MIIACGDAILLYKIAGRVTDPPLHSYIVGCTVNYNLNSPAHREPPERLVPGGCLYFPAPASMASTSARVQRWSPSPLRR